MAPGTAWLLENVVFQSLNGTIWATMLIGLMTIGGTLAAATAAALAACILVPILGWFIGAQLVIGFAMGLGVLWLMAFVGVVFVWACTAAAVAAATFGRRALDMLGSGRS
jgi:hypothetical protein